MVRAGSGAWSLVVPYAHQCKFGSGKHKDACKFERAPEGCNAARTAPERRAQSILEASYRDGRDSICSICPSTRLKPMATTDLAARVLALEKSVGKNTEVLSTLPGSVDTFYYLFVGSLVFFMQAGFGLLEAGSVRTKNTKNILLKNLLDACIGAIVWWAWGYAVAVKLPVLRPARSPAHQPYR